MVKSVMFQFLKSNPCQHRQPDSSVVSNEISLKINLVGQLHLLSSAISMLAVSSPSLTATLARGETRQL
ncbi:hypothetical protein OROMI_002582 [Orobanche minor]